MVSSCTLQASLAIFLEHDLVAFWALLLSLGVACAAFLKHLDMHALKFIRTRVTFGDRGEVALVSPLVPLPFTVGHRRSQSAHRGMASRCLCIGLPFTQLLALRVIQTSDPVGREIGRSRICVAMCPSQGIAFGVQLGGRRADDPCGAGCRALEPGG